MRITRVTDVVMAAAVLASALCVLADSSATVPFPADYRALERAKTRMNTGDETNRRMVSLLKAIASSSRYVTRLAIRSGSKTSFIKVEEIDWIQAAENYVELHTGSTRHLLQVAIHTLQSSLDPELFVRIHRSVIVNIGRIQELQPASHGEYVIVLRGGVRLPLSRKGESFDSESVLTGAAWFAAIPAPRRPSYASALRQQGLPFLLTKVFKKLSPID